MALRQLTCAAVGAWLLAHVGTAFLGGSVRPSLRERVILHAEDAVSTGDRVQMKVLSPEGMGVTEACSEVILPSASGQLGVLANHAPMMTAIDVGVLRYKQDGTWKPLVVLGGFATVDSNQLSILVNDFEKVEDIDLDTAKKDMEEATSELEKADSKKGKLDATNKVKKSAARLQAAMFAQKK